MDRIFRPVSEQIKYTPGHDYGSDHCRRCLPVSQLQRKANFQGNGWDYKAKPIWLGAAFWKWVHGQASR
jgi:hypothetical protein